MTAPVGGRPVVLRPGAPATVVAVVAPCVAVGLVVWRATATGLAATPDDPVPPWVMAVLTVAAGAVVALRSVTQHAELGGPTLRCRNLLTTFHVDWDRVEELVVRRRGPLVIVEIRIRSLRRRHRLGAATRFAGATSDDVLELLAAHPSAGPRLVDDGAP